jgi:RNA polymerase sigma factor (sigma-70 family)
MSNVVAFRPRLTPAQQGLVDGVRRAGVLEKLAQPLARKFVGMITEDDLVGLGDDGLVDAATRHQAAIGPFLPYARCRIRGAMYDGIRVESFEARVRRAGVRVTDEVLTSYQDDFDSQRHDRDERQRRLDRFSDEVLVGTFLAETEEAQKACSPDEVTEQAELAGALAAQRECVKELPPKQQRIVELVVKGGQTHEQAAAIMDVDVSTIGRNLRAALRQLRKLMSLRGYDALPDPSVVCEEPEEPEGTKR